jgi:iron complex transport system permease protein
MQSVLKNPLADPFTTGVSSGASFGATNAITTGMINDQRVKTRAFVLDRVLF